MLEHMLFTMFDVPAYKKKKITGEITGEMCMNIDVKPKYCFVYNIPMGCA